MYIVPQIEVDHIENICFLFELVHLKVDISHSIDIFFMSVRQIYTEFRTQVHRDRDGRKRILIAFITLQKCNVLLSL